MALFCSPCKFPIPCPKSQINYAIQTPFSSKTSIPKTDNLEIAKLSISIPPKQICSSLSSRSDSDKGFPSNVIIFVQGLALSTTEGVLKAAFSRFGEVSRVKLIRDRKTKESLGFAYVWFVKEEHTQAAVAEMNGEFFEGRFVNVSLARPEFCRTRRKHTPYRFN